MRDTLVPCCARHSAVKRITRESDYAWNRMTSHDTSSPSQRCSAISYIYFQMYPHARIAASGEKKTIDLRRSDARGTRSNVVGETCLSPHATELITRNHVEGTGRQIKEPTKKKKEKICILRRSPLKFSTRLVMVFRHAKGILNLHRYLFTAKEQ